MLGQLEDMAGKNSPDVQKAFKSYAINERARENVEKIIGGSVSDIDKMYSANPESVVKKIFSNPNNAKIVESYVGTEKMQQLKQSFVNKGVSGSFDRVNGFSPVDLRQWLKTNESFVKNYLDTGTATRLQDMADYGYLGKRFLAEVNPSGTAASLNAMINPSDLLSNVKKSGLVGGVTTTVADKANKIMNQKNAINYANTAMGTPPINKVQSTVPSGLITRLGARAMTEKKKRPEIKGGE